MMKLTLLQENLIRGLNIVNRSVSSKPSLPILSNILLTAFENRLKLSSTNLETSITFWLDAKIEKEGKFTVPARVLTEFVSSLSPGVIEISLEGNLLVVSSANTKSSFNGLSADEFPAIPEAGETKTPLFFETLLPAVEKVGFAAAADEFRPALTAILFRIAEKETEVVATDGYRLSLVKIPGETLSFPVGEKKDFLVPAKTMVEVVRIAAETLKGKGEKKPQLSVSFLSKESQLIFATTEAEIVSRLIDAEFPQYSRIIPAEWKTRITVGREELTQAVKIASIFSRENANIIRWKITKEGLKVSAASSQVGENSSLVGIKLEGEENEIAFNARYPIELLSALSEETELVFEMSGPLNPGVFRIPGNDNFLHLIMPVRLQEEQ
ncbi:MAG: DNA polymerase III subunit beta [bacterium]|nr:DNA polymerase III subunit beta [bacterium]